VVLGECISMQRRGCPPHANGDQRGSMALTAGFPNPTLSAAQTLINDNESMFHAFESGLAGVPAGSV
jgi:hypothetical protein